MRTTAVAWLLVCCAFLAPAAKKVVDPTTTAANEQVDLKATIVTDPADIHQILGVDPGPGLVLLKVRVTPKVDKPMYISPDDFILLAHDDGERHQPFAPSQIAGQGAMVVTAKPASQGKKTSAIGGFGGLMGGGGSSSPGNTPPVNVQGKMDDKKPGNQKLLDALQAKALVTKESVEPVEGYLYFELDGKHKLKNLEVLYRGAAGRLNMPFAQ